jgi:hypothetical protein
MPSPFDFKKFKKSPRPAKEIIDDILAYRMEELPSETFKRGKGGEGDWTFENQLGDMIISWKNPDRNVAKIIASIPIDDPQSKIIRRLEEYDQLLAGLENYESNPASKPIGRNALALIDLLAQRSEYEATKSKVSIEHPEEYDLDKLLDVRFPIYDLSDHAVSDYLNGTRQAIILRERIKPLFRELAAVLNIPLDEGPSAVRR